MDKRIILLIAIFFIGSLSFFLYRKVYYKHKGIGYTIMPNSSIKVGDSIIYRDLTPDATRWKWDFGDGEFSADASGKHFYLVPGQFNVTLTAYGPFGVLKDSRTKVVVISDEGIMQTTAAEPMIIGPSDLKAGQSARYASNLKAGSYEWKIEGDLVLAAHMQEGNTATYTFSKPGQRTLVLTMHNPDYIVRKDITVTPLSLPHPAQKPLRNRPVRHHSKGNNDLEDFSEGMESGNNE